MPTTKRTAILFLVFMLLSRHLFGEPPKTCQLLLPKVIYATPGVEANLYFGNVVLSPPGRSNLFDVTCAKGRQLQDRWTFTPDATDSGDLPLTLEVHDLDDKLIASASTTIRISNQTNRHQTFTLLPIGDSLTEASVYTYELLQLFDKHNTPLTLLGTHKTENQANVNEGYGGWRFQDFAEKFDLNARPDNQAKRNSPFVFSGPKGPTLDFSRYLKENFGNASPEFITIFLGVNDNFSCTDSTIDASIATMFLYCDKLLGAIRFACPKAIIGIIPPVPPAESQDAFGINYGCGQTRWQYRKNQHRVVERMIEKFGDRQAQGIYLVPAYVNIDCAYNYPSSAQPANSRTPTKIVRMENGVHPSEDGYRQIADSIYSWMLNVQ